MAEASASKALLSAGKPSFLAAIATCVKFPFSRSARVFDWRYWSAISRAASMLRNVLRSERDSDSYLMPRFLAPAPRKSSARLPASYFRASSWTPPISGSMRPEQASASALACAAKVVSCASLAAFHASASSALMIEYLMPFMAFSGPEPAPYLAKPETSCFMNTRK